MRWLALLAAIALIPPAAGAAPAGATGTQLLSVNATVATLNLMSNRGPSRPINPQAGVAWGGGLADTLDAVSSRTWRAQGVAVLLGYQQRAFAPQPPATAERGYNAMLKDAPDMMGLSFTLRSH